MKKAIFRTALFSLSLLFCFVAQTNAQLNFGGTLSLGTSTVSNHDGNMMRFGAFNIGGFASFQAADNVSLVGELTLANRGDSYELDFSSGIPPFQVSGTYDGNLLMNYLQLSLIAMYMNDLILGGGGIYVGSLLSAVDKGTSNFNGMTEDYDEDWKDEAESIDLGIQLEVLYRITEMISAGVTGQIGLAKVYDPGSGDAPKNCFFGLKARVQLTDN